MFEPDPDLPLWQDLQGGNDSALETLMDRHKESLFRFIYRYVQSEEDARDLLQETFVRAYFKRHQFQPRARILAWLFRIALNLCRDHARSRAGKQERRTDSLFISTENDGERIRDIPSAAIGPDRMLENKEQSAMIEAAIQELPHDLKAAFVLTVLEDHSHKSCAELLGTTPKAIESRVARARKFLEGKFRGAHESGLKNL
jgi:RNA polymerase sigma-70 factor (ECF subfamily)